jgi:uncharacterized protein (TIGR03435 family)
MPDVSDMDLLRDYQRQGSEEAFAELVRRHVNLVYSAALRHAGIAAHAEEITQAVFVILARKAAGLRPDTILDAWLYETTRWTALSFLRGERRRQWREQEAYMQSTFRESTGDSVWHQLSPLLDEAMSRLGKKDREAVVLRFFKDKSLREVAAALQVTEAAAQSRVHRALEKLHRYFARRGVSSTTAIIAGAISANSVQAAPVALAKAVSAVAAAKGAAASGSTLTLIKGALKIMAWTKAKTAVVSGVVVLLAAGTATITIKEIQAHHTYPWQIPNADFATLYKMPPDVKILPTKFATNGVASSNGGRGAMGAWSDGGRGAMGIAQPLQIIIQMAYRSDELHTFYAVDLPTNRFDFFAKLVGPQETNKPMPVNTNWTIALQKEIQKKFGIAGHLEMRQADALVLSPAASGIMGFTNSHKMPKGIAFETGAGKLAFHEQPVGILVMSLQQKFQMPVINQTDIKGAYDFSLNWDEPDRTHPNPDGLKQALHDQLGLDLISTNIPMKMLVVEKVK